MKKCGCSYWFKWYAKLFKKRFEVDNPDEIILRLNIPQAMAKGAAEVARYMLGLNRWGTERLNEARIIILGDKGAGKTSLALRLEDINADLPKDDESTEGVDVIRWHIPETTEQPNNSVNVHIWDFAGHVITHAIHRCFMSERCLYILLIDGRTEGVNTTEYWLEQMRNYGGNSQVLILINIRDNQHVELQENNLRNEFTNILSFHYINLSKDIDKLEIFQTFVMTLMRDNPIWINQKVTIPAYKVKEVLLEKFEEGNEFIHRDDFSKIALENNVPSKEHLKLLEDLHALGLCLWYDDNEMGEFDTMVLNPGWISHGIYRLINWGSNEKKQILSKDDFNVVFAGIDVNRYKNHSNFIFCLMQRYQLAFTKNEDEIFVPLLMSSDRPEFLTEDEINHRFPFGERLLMEYRANQALPPYTVTRLAVLHSKELDINNSWRFGVLLNWQDTSALVEESERSRTITVFVSGAKQTEYIARIRDTFNNIFNEYKSNQPELKYEVIPKITDVDNIESQLITTFALTDKKKFLQPEIQIVGNAVNRQDLVIDKDIPLINPYKTIKDYAINIFNNPIYVLNSPHTQVGGHGNVINHSTTVNTKFEIFSNHLQGEINNLIEIFNQKGECEMTHELKAVALGLERAIKEVPEDASPDSPDMRKVRTLLRKEGLLGKLENLYDELSNEKSDLREKMRKIHNGIKKVQRLGKSYNNIAEWLALPQIPSPLLRSDN